MYQKGEGDGGGEGYFVPPQQEVQTSTLLCEALEIAIWLDQGSPKTGKASVSEEQPWTCLGLLLATP